MSDHIQRMKAEYNELKDKCTDLAKFINLNDVFKTLEHEEQVRMIQQLGFMQAYLNVLDQRLWCAHNPTSQK